MTEERRMRWRSPDGWRWAMVKGLEVSGGEYGVEGED